ncbi:energy transducer TonB [Phenylobacterium koreense]|uniref:Outer membrane biosynthesis protein TonB n=1 Tax=Phenylobacterium koreense TaxID=266125 RepID=A0ABV2EH51_9CAUL
MARERSEFSGAMVASALLHVGIFAVALIGWPWGKELPMGSAVPINIVANAPSTNLAPAVEGPEELPAQTEEPVPDAPTPPAAPEPQPVPTPPQPTPKAAPQPAPQAKPAPAPTPKPAPKPAAKTPAKPAPKAEKGLDLDALAASVAKSGGQRSSAAKGPSRPATAQQARPDLGTGQAAAAISGMSGEIERRWNPNCAVEGGRDVKLKLSVTLGTGGRVVGEVTAGGAERSSNAVVRAAAERAIRAVYAAAPFPNVPRSFYGDPIILNFNTRDACS